MFFVSLLVAKAITLFVNDRSSPIAAKKSFWSYYLLLEELFFYINFNLCLRYRFLKKCHLSQGKICSQKSGSWREPQARSTARRRLCYRSDCQLLLEGKEYRCHRR